MTIGSFQNTLTASATVDCNGNVTISGQAHAGNTIFITPGNIQSTVQPDGTYTVTFNAMPYTNTNLNFVVETYPSYDVFCQTSQQVGPLPVLVVTPTVTNNCKGSPSTVALAIQGGNGTYNLSIDGGPNNPYISGTPISIATSGTHTFAVTDTSTSTVCATVSATTLVGGLTVNITGTATPCPGTTISLNASVTGGTPSYTYTWSGPNGFFQSGPSASVTIPNAQAVNTGTYLLNVMDSGVCTGSSSFPVQVSPSFSVSLSGPTNVCPNGSFTLNAVVTPSGSYTYQWFGPNGQIVVPPTQSSITVSNANPNVDQGSYSVIVTDANGCTQTTSQFVTVSFQLINVLISGPTTVCQNGTIQLAAIVPTGSSYTFAWTGPNGFQSSDSMISVPATSLGSQVFTVTVNDTVSNCVGFTQTTVNVIPSPTVMLSGNATVCPGGTVTLTATPSPAAGSYTYEWFGPTGPIIVPDTQNTITIPNALPTDTGVYAVLVKDNVTGCTAGTQTLVLVTVNELTVTPTPAQSTACVGSTVQLTALVQAAPNASGSYSFLWNGPNGFTSTQQTIQAPVVSVGDNTYAVLATDLNTNCVGLGQATITGTSCVSPITVQGGTANGSTTINAQGTTTFTFSVTNTSTNPITNIVDLVQLPSCFKFCKAVDVTGAGWIFTQNGQTVTASLPTLAPGQKATFNIVVKAHCCKHKFITVLNTVEATNVPPQTITIKLCAK